MSRCRLVARRFSRGRALGVLAASMLAVSSLMVSAFAENNGVSLTPQLGWSSWSFVRRGPTEAINVNYYIDFTKPEHRHSLIPGLNFLRLGVSTT